MKAIVLLLLLFPWKDYQVIDKGSPMYGVKILAKEIKCGSHVVCFHRKYVTARKYTIYGVRDYWVFDKNQLKRWEQFNRH